MPSDPRIPLPLAHTSEQIQAWLARGASTWLPTELRHVATWTTSLREDLIRSGTTLWESVRRDRWGLLPPQRRIVVVEPGQPPETSWDWAALCPIDVFHAYAGRKLRGNTLGSVERFWGPDERCRDRALAGVAVAMHERYTLPVRGRRITVEVEVSMTNRTARLSFDGRATSLWLSVDEELDRSPARTWSAAVFGSYALYKRAVLPRTAALPLRNRRPETAAFERYLHDLEDLPSVSRQPHERRQRVADAIAHLPTFVRTAKAADYPDLGNALARIERFLPEDSDFPGHAACRAADLAFVRGDRAALERIVAENLATWESRPPIDATLAVRQRANLALLSGQPDEAEAIVVAAIRDCGRRVLRDASCATRHVATGTRNEPIDTAAALNELCRELDRVRTPPHWIDSSREHHWTHALT